MFAYHTAYKNDNVQLISVAARTDSAGRKGFYMTDNRAQTIVQRKQVKALADKHTGMLTIQRKDNKEGLTLNENSSEGTTIQRVVKYTKKSPPFSFEGRAGEHATEPNKRALIELMTYRNNTPNHQTGNVNNETETDFIKKYSVNSKTTPSSFKLDMAHHVSDAVIQEKIVAAANNPTGNLWNELDTYIDGIKPPQTYSNILPEFYKTSEKAHTKAVNILKEVVNIFTNKKKSQTDKMAKDLTRLASAIINSPMNLHYGDKSTNSSIGYHGDPNTFQPQPPQTFFQMLLQWWPWQQKPTLHRKMTWRSQQMRDKLSNNNYDPAEHDRTLAEALAMDPDTVAHKQAKAFNAPDITGYSHNSSAPKKFVKLQ